MTKLGVVPVDMLELDLSASKKIIYLVKFKYIQVLLMSASESQYNVGKISDLKCGYTINCVLFYL